MKFLQILILLFGLTIFANAQKAILSGTVYDMNGAVIPNTKVVAQNKSGKLFETRTDENGIYNLELLPDIYNIEISRGGFAAIKLNNYRVPQAFDGKMNFDVSLSVVGDGVICRLTVSSAPKTKIKRKSYKRKNKNK